MSGSFAPFPSLNWDGSICQGASAFQLVLNNTRSEIAKIIISHLYLIMDEITYLQIIGTWLDGLILEHGLARSSQTKDTALCLQLHQKLVLARKVSVKTWGYLDKGSKTTTTTTTMNGGHQCSRH